MNHLANPTFQRVDSLFVLSFENEDDRKSNYYLGKVTIKDYNVMIHGTKIFDQPRKILEKSLLVKEMITQLVVC